MGAGTVTKRSDQVRERIERTRRRVVGIGIGKMEKGVGDRQDVSVWTLFWRVFVWLLCPEISQQRAGSHPSLTRRSSREDGCVHFGEDQKTDWFSDSQPTLRDVYPGYGRSSPWSFHARDGQAVAPKES